MTAMEDRCAPYLAKLRSEPYASIVPARTPAVKYHAGLNRAKSAVAYSVSVRDDSRRYGWRHHCARGGEIYTLGPDGWELVYRVEHGTPSDELPWKVKP